MGSASGAVRCVLGLVLVTGCASTKVTDRTRYEGTEKLARPNRIIVHDFTADATDVPRESPFAADLASAGTPSAQQIALGDKLGAQIAKQLVADLRAMGLPAVEAAGQPLPRVDDIVLRGYFVTLAPGSATKRVLLGFGSGSAELQTVVEGYQMTAQGLRSLRSSEVRSAGGQLPGVVLPAAVLAATANPIGLAVGGTAKLAGEASGSATIEGAAKRTADEIAVQIKTAAQRQGWI
ncbi:MAG TPA: DUF4410 domain-containing protein [Candidatus Eisenbacteria bacterium]|nr:DUF4410 domain-containing protein [Candidatus Eisenbacteria bacterium]